MNEKPPAAAPPNPTREGQRIAKVMARAGLCSRRDAESWILAGRVSVNGKILESPAFNVTAADDIRVDGQRLKEAERTRLFLFHKPRGLVTTARDPEGRPTIFDALPEDLPRVVAVGRLDINTEGLLLLTNDGGLARVLELPATGWLRRYRVRAHGAIDQARLDALREGVTIEGVHYAGIEARLEREQGSNVWITMGLREGKNREIKRVLEHLGLSVNRLIRVSFGPFELGDLAEGEVAEVRTRVLRDQLGVKLAREAGVNFDLGVIDRGAPPPAPPPAPKRAERRGAGGRERPARGGLEPRGAMQPREPEPSQAPRKRKHVSALRAEIAAETRGPRKRIERSATSDRKGREIKVERIVATPEELRRRAAETARRERARQRGAPRSEAETRDRRAGKPFEKRATAGEGRAPSREGGKPFGKRPPPGEGRPPPRGESRPFEKRASSGEGRPPSGEARKPFGKRPPSGEGRSPPRGEGRPFEKRAPSREGGKPFGKRPSSGEGRPPPRGPRPGGKRPPGRRP
ncbi:MAG TPA: pseudouridine synthase [Roseiarcus sp.]|nr:pseudouridine synthase [Roseiarcus sp.]